MMQKTEKKRLKPWNMGIHLGVLSESYPKNTNMMVFNHVCAPVLRTQVAVRLEVLKVPILYCWPEAIQPWNRF